MNIKNLEKINVKAQDDVKAIFNVLSKYPKIQKITILGAAITDKYTDSDTFFISIDTTDIDTFIDACKVVSNIVDGTVRDIDYINGADKDFYTAYKKELENGVIIYENR